MRAYIKRYFFSRLFLHVSVDRLSASHQKPPVEVLQLLLEACQPLPSAMTAIQRRCDAPKDLCAGLELKDPPFQPVKYMAEHFIRSCGGVDLTRNGTSSLGSSAIPAGT